MLERLQETFGDDLRLVYRHFPLVSIHDKAQITAEASEAAGAQDKFWEMHDLLYERQRQWAALTPEEMIDTLTGYADELGLDTDAFEEDLRQRTYQEKVEEAYQEAVSAQLSGTPSFIVNGVRYPSSWGLSYQGLEAFSRLMQLRERMYATPPEQVLVSGRQYLATLHTDKGDIVIRLFSDSAPTNVNSFVFLAHEGYYDGVTFHRVLPGFVAQGGDPTGTGIGFPGYQCEDEITPQRTFDREGLVAIANSGPNTNGSQFFITYGPQPELDGRFTIIGEVVEGMDVARNLTPRDPVEDPLAPPGDIIQAIIISEE